VRSAERRQSKKSQAHSLIQGREGQTDKIFPTTQLPRPFSFAPPNHHRLLHSTLIGRLASCLGPQPFSPSLPRTVLVLVEPPPLSGIRSSIPGSPLRQPPPECERLDQAQDIDIARPTHDRAKQASKQIAANFESFGGLALLAPCGCLPASLSRRCADLGTNGKKGLTTTFKELLARPRCSTLLVVCLALRSLLCK
jgi:hypothetical protein